MLYRDPRFLAFLFVIPAFSLAGFPPLSGFWAKIMLIKASLAGGFYVVAAAAAVVGLLTVYSMSKIWGEAFWKSAPAGVRMRPDAADVPAGDVSARSEEVWMFLPIALLALVTIVIGLVPGPFVAMAGQAAHELLHPEIYVKAVLGRV